jgi:hypothetical protein
MVLVLQKVFAKIKLFKNQELAILARKRAKMTEFAIRIFG